GARRTRARAVYLPASMARSARLWLALLTAAIAALVGVRQVWTQRAAPAARARPAGRLTSAAPAQGPTAAPAGELRYIASGGGSTPESTEISLEQNLALARDALPGPGKLLFAGGAGSLSVRTLQEQPADEL